MGTIKTIEVHAKLLLSGEHSVLYGAPAVGLPLPLSLQLNFTPHPRRPSAQQLFSPTVQRLLADYPRFTDEVAHGVLASTSNGGEIDIDSTIPLGAGLGSSAALCVACAKLLRLLRNDGGEDEHAVDGRGDQHASQAVWREAHRLESHFHGHSSGVDTGIIANAAAMLFWHRPESRQLLQTGGSVIPPPDPSAHYRLQPINHGLSLVLAIIVLPRAPATSTRRMIASVADTHSRAELRRFCDETKRFAEQCAQLTAANATSAPPTTALPAEFCECIRRLHRLQQQLGISTTEIDAFIEQACACGAEAGKVSGAGGGGAAFVLFRNRDALTNALPQLARFCDARYRRQHRLYSGEWRGDGWHGFRSHHARAD